MDGIETLGLKHLGAQPPLSPDELLSPLFRPQHKRAGKIKRLTGEDDAQAFHNAKIAQANLPWFLRPRYREEDIQLATDGSVKAGTLPALVEHLLADTLSADPSTSAPYIYAIWTDSCRCVDLQEQELFRRAFLVTFRTFATAREVFDLLLANYELQQPDGLSTSEASDWKQKKLRPMQKRILDVFRMWLEDYDLLNQDHEIASSLSDFLRSIQQPSSLSLTAKHILISLERLVC